MMQLNGLLDIAATVKEAAPQIQKLKKATDGLESYMFKSLLKSMGGEKGLFGNKVPGADIYKDMFEQSLSDIMSERGSLGIGKTIFKNVAPLAMQEARNRLRTAAKSPSITPTIENKV